MDEKKWDALDALFCEALVPSDAALDAALRSSAEAGLPAIGVSANQGKFLHLLALMQGASRILEIGTLGGYSTIWMGRALPADGTLVSLEINEDYARIARDNLARANLSSVAHVVVGAAAESLQHLIDEQSPPFDMIFMDADKKSYPRYLELSLHLLRPGGIIVGDNVARRGRILTPGTDDADVVGLRRFFDMLAQDKRLTTTALQTVGSKGWDGFSLTRMASHPA
ncbi:O-methyltransferase [Robbsia sp. Bb-Pol-6]|uniref:O-methyltransferase n=1 Tax=Robbsia betulipollinis TaxID=2981849 RepID=A0ABT3ZLK7_9BURK|nr:O-methyltransferase [Robbsia betulipollinis]MCY0387415.1 O-methyltransferase [Robbsia betulipollinis]